MKSEDCEHLEKGRKMRVKETQKHKFRKGKPIVYNPRIPGKKIINLY